MLEWCSEAKTASKIGLKWEAVWVVSRAVRLKHSTSRKGRWIYERDEHAKYARSCLKLLKDITNSIIERVNHPRALAIH